MTRSTLLAGLVLAVAGAIAGYAWYRTLTAEPATNPRVMTWHKADGGPPTDPPDDPYPFDGCDGDIGLDLAVWRGGVIVACDDPAIGIGWAWIDPAAKRAELRWPVGEGGRIARTIGVIPGPGDQLAIVFDRDLGTDTAVGEIFVGIAAPHGWARAPESLGRVVYRAAAWVGPRLEVVVTPTTADDKYGMHQANAIVTLAGGPRTEGRGLPTCAGSGCYPPHISYRAGGRWVFESSGHAVTETGEPAASVVPEGLMAAAAAIIGCSDRSALSRGSRGAGPRSATGPPSPRA